MGGGPDKEHLLITLWEPEPKELLADLKRRFPYFDITYIQVAPPGKAFVDVPSDIPEDLWKTVTILITLSTWPARPELVPNLKLIHLFSAGVDRYITHPIMTESDIAVTTSSGIHGPPITEWIILTTLAASRKFAVSYEWQKEKQWGPDRRSLFGTTDWVGKTVGIAGYGSIGRQAARVFSALGSSIHAYTASPRTTPTSRADTGYIIPGTGDVDGTIPSAWYSGTDKTSLHTFLASGLDALVICLPLTDATKHIFSTEEFKILGSGPPSGPPSGSASGSAPAPKKAFVINIARGGLIDQPALITALNDSTLSGAALDVADPEPLPSDDPLWDAKNVIITPHISAMGIEYTSRAYDLFATNWARRERGEKMFNLVDRRRGY